MSNPFQEHAQNTADYQTMLKGDDDSGGAALTFTSLIPPVTVDCRFEKVVDDFELMGGQSPKQMVPSCKFLSLTIPDAQKPFIRKGLNCELKPNPAWPAIPLKIWSGGIVQGGLEYDFVLVDRNYMA